LDNFIQNIAEESVIVHTQNKWQVYNVWLYHLSWFCS